MMYLRFFRYLGSLMHLLLAGVNRIKFLVPFLDAAPSPSVLSLGLEIIKPLY